jgi:hypothetical protein
VNAPCSPTRLTRISPGSHPRLAGRETTATGKKAASDAGEQLASKTSNKAEKEVAASDLAQAKKAAPAKKTGGKN